MSKHKWKCNECGGTKLYGSDHYIRCAKCGRYVTDIPDTELLRMVSAK